MNPETELAKALGYEVDFAVFNRLSVTLDPVVLRFITLAATYSYARSVTGHEDQMLGEALQGQEEAWGSVHLGLAAEYETQAAAIVGIARSTVVTMLISAGVLITRQEPEGS